MDRYQTRWYCCTSAEEAARLAELDDTIPEEIRVTFGVEPLHVKDTLHSAWILWSDGKFTTAIGAKLSSGGQLSPDAVRLISTVRGADGGSVEGGLLKLAAIAAIEGQFPVSIGPSRGHYARETVECLKVLWKDGTRGNLYTLSVGYCEGYQFDVYDTLEALLAAAHEYEQATEQLAQERPEGGE